MVVVGQDPDSKHPKGCWRWAGRADIRYRRAVSRCGVNKSTAVLFRDLTSSIYPTSVFKSKILATLDEQFHRRGSQ